MTTKATKSGDTGPDTAPQTATAPQQPAMPAPQVQYKLHADGVITRSLNDSAPVPVATYRHEDGVLTITAPQFTNYLLVFCVDEKLKLHAVHYPPAVPQGVAQTLTLPGQRVLDPPGPMKYTPPAGSPPVPPLDPKLGDKTPAFVDFLFQYDRAEFNRRYQVIGEGTVTKFAETREPITGKPIRTPYTERALLSRRKTHRTETPDASTGGAS